MSCQCSNFLFTIPIQFRSVEVVNAQFKSPLDNLHCFIHAYL